MLSSMNPQEMAALQVCVGCNTCALCVCNACACAMRVCCMHIVPTNKPSIKPTQHPTQPQPNPNRPHHTKAEVAGLIAEVSAAESKKAALELQLDAGRKQRTLLGDRIQDLELTAAAGDAELGRVKGELDALLAKMGAAAAAAAAAGGDGAAAMEVGDVCDSLVKAAAAYRSLFSAVQGRGVDVPYAASLNNVGALVWVETLLAGTADWMYADGPAEGDEEAGFSVVNALPELEGVPPALLRIAGGPVAMKLPLKRAAATAGGDQGAAAAATGAEGAGAPAAAAAAAPKAAAAAGAVGAIAAAVGSEAAPAAAAAEDAAAAAAPAAAAAASSSFEDAAFPSADAAASAFAPAATGAAAAAAAATAGLGFEEAPAFGRASTADSVGLEHDLANPFSSAEGGAVAAALASRQSDATDSSAFEDNAF